jgi:hypothetical protein
MDEHVIKPIKQTENSAKLIEKPSKPPARLKPETHQPRGHKPARRKRAPIRSLPVQIALTLAKVIVVGYVVVLVVLVYMEDRLVYPGAFSSETIGMVPDSAIETVTYESTGDVTLAGRLLVRPEPTHVILYFHGNASKANWMDRWVKSVSETFNATVMAAEYRGYADDVPPTERGLIEDGLAARDYLCTRFGLTPDDIVIYGCSLGGGVASAVASRNGAKALILESTFDRMVHVAADRYPFIPVRLLMKNRFDSVAQLTNYKGPLIQIHGRADTIVPFEYGKTLFDSVRASPKHFIDLPNHRHIERLPDEVMREIADKLNEFTRDDLEPVQAAT